MATSRYLNGARNYSTTQHDGGNVHIIDGAGMGYCWASLAYAKYSRIQFPITRRTTFDCWSSALAWVPKPRYLAQLPIACISGRQPSAGYPYLAQMSELLVVSLSLST